jgi:hypothetical protein
MAKTHFQLEGTIAACGRSPKKWALTDNALRVTCGQCATKPAYIDALAVAAAEKMERFLAQEPRTIKEPWMEGTMTCSNCGGEKFREADRTCYGHYSNHVCADCGHNESRLTETGMSF